jgi:hypothetical protein
MAARKVDVEVTHLDDATALQTGERVSIEDAGDGARLVVKNKAGQQIGNLSSKEESVRHFLRSGTAVVRTLRKQQGAVLQVIVRVTEVPSQPASSLSTSSHALCSKLVIYQHIQCGFGRGGRLLTDFVTPILHGNASCRKDLDKFRVIVRQHSHILNPGADVINSTATFTHPLKLALQKLGLALKSGLFAGKPPEEEDCCEYRVRHSQLEKLGE